MNIIEAMRDPGLFGPFFKEASWRPWEAPLGLLFGVSVPDDLHDMTRACTGLDTVPEGPFAESWWICGRRSGKSRVTAFIGTFLATFIDWCPYLAPGERGQVLILAADRQQARVIFGYVKGFLDEIPLLQARVEHVGADEIELHGRVTIRIATSSYKSVRGATMIAVLADECAFWSDEVGANPATEIFRALRPGLATIPGARLICLTTPYARKGPPWEAFARYFGKPGEKVLVWRAPSKTMNPGLDNDFLRAEYERDPVNAASEFGAEFRSELETYVRREAVENAIVPDRFELPRVSGVKYKAFVDPSGGSADSMTLAIAHRAEDRGILDAVREIRPPFAPDGAVAEFAGLLRSYGLNCVSGDRYGGEWPRERFWVHGIRYELSDRPRSDIYRDLLPALNSGTVELLDVPQLKKQFCALQRRAGRGGKDIIDHPIGEHDDVANAVAGALLLACAAATRSVTVRPLPY